MKLIKILSILLIILLGLMFFASKLVTTYWYSPLKHLTEPQLYTVASGSGFNAVANDLSAKNILKRPLLTSLWVRFLSLIFY